MPIAPQLRCQRSGSTTERTLPCSMESCGCGNVAWADLFASYGFAAFDGVTRAGQRPTSPQVANLRSPAAPYSSCPAWSKGHFS